MSNRFHGRVSGNGKRCDHPDCRADGEFRAPDPYGERSGFDGPGSYRWLCFDHVRAFNASYNFFTGMDRDEIERAQMPFGGWETESRAFTQGGVDSPPKWRDFHDPLDAIAARFKRRVDEAMPQPRADGRPLSTADRKALAVLSLTIDADRRALRSRYAELLRKFHPDRNGGDRTHERALQAVIDAYAQLKRSAAFWA